MYLSAGFSHFISGACVAVAINLFTSTPLGAKDIVCALLLLLLGAEFAYLAGLVERADRYSLVHLVRAPSLSPQEFRGTYESEISAVRPQMLTGLLLVALSAIGLIITVILWREG